MFITNQMSSLILASSTIINCIAATIRQSSDCGLSRKPYLKSTEFLRVIGGTDARRGEFPWILIHNGSRNHLCGGAIINDHYILTAAHCVHNQYVEHHITSWCDDRIDAHIDSKTNFTDTLVVTYGSLNSTFGFERRISRIEIHPKNGLDTTGDNFADIALLRIVYPIKRMKVFGYYLVNHICLPDAKRVYKGFATLAGWGQTRQMHPKTKLWIYSQTDQLFKANNMPIVGQTRCRELYQGSRYNLSKYIDNRVICCGTGNRGSWSGDSGGPLVYYNDTDMRAVVVGVASMTEPFDWTKPSIFTKVSQFMVWIEDIIASND